MPGQGVGRGHAARGNLQGPPLPAGSGLLPLVQRAADAPTTCSLRPSTSEHSRLPKLKMALLQRSAMMGTSQVWLIDPAPGIVACSHCSHANCWLGLGGRWTDWLRAALRLHVVASALMHRARLAVRDAPPCPPRCRPAGPPQQRRVRRVQQAQGPARHGSQVRGCGEALALHLLGASRRTTQPSTPPQLTRGPPPPLSLVVRRLPSRRAP